ncbi:MAG: four helix bundle protein, partial [Balneolaceae bacterium]
MKENIILKKTYDFAIRIVNLHTYLCEKTRKFEIAKQLLRSGTS